MQAILIGKLSGSLMANDHRALYDADGASLRVEIRAAPEQQLRLIL
jgi:hypothetical protein